MIYVDLVVVVIQMMVALSNLQRKTVKLRPTLFSKVKLKGESITIEKPFETTKIVLDQKLVGKLKKALTCFFGFSDVVVSTQEEQDLVTQLKKFGVFIEDKGLADELKLLNSFLNGFKYPNQSKYLPPEVNNDAGKMAGRVDLLECLNKRKSGDKAGKILKHSDIKDILFSSYYNQTKINLSLHRPVPSAGKFYPLIYYYFDFAEKKLYYVDKDSNLDFILKSARPDHLVSYLEYFKIDISAWNGIILTFADLSKSQAKYDLRSYVFSLIECGHVMQNIILSCLALGTETRQIGLLNSNVVDEYLDIKNNENLFLHAILV